MKKLGWAMDGGFWDVDVSTPVTLEGVARPVPGDPLPLGISRGTKLSRPKQLHFFQRFMSSPFIPSFSSHRHGHGFSLQSVLAFPTFSQNWFGTLLGQFNFQKFVSESGASLRSSSSSLNTIGRQLCDASLYALGFSSELSFTPDDTLLFNFNTHGDATRNSRKKAVLHHKFPNHNLTLEAVSPALFIDSSDNYWDVPFSMAIDLASLPSDSGPSYHFCMHHNAGDPKLFGGGHTLAVPAPLLPGFSFKSAFAFKKNIDIWRSKAPKLKMVQPFDLFISNPHISASGIVGATMTAYIGDNSVRCQEVDRFQSFTGLSLRAIAPKSALLADMFSSVSLTAQHGNFQRLFLDLTRCHLRLDFPSGSKFLSGAAKLAQDFFNSQQPSMETIKAICPNATISLQQQKKRYPWK
ncbi:protein TRIGALACTOSYLDIACYLGLYCEROL 4, chloroplastic isoform X2 [Ricinus communis]|uniref:protein TRIGALACTOSYLDIACYLGLYCEROL 4, chloroplastic isoform X2 n=1 Tax=Ricinus communis TaxID=3988 RepID=UPI00201A2B53|nr:protein TRIGALACTOSYLDIACYLGLYCEROL 4, chloroplastic isoform X2 [Ricinus communis]